LRGSGLTGSESPTSPPKAANDGRPGPLDPLPERQREATPTQRAFRAYWAANAGRQLLPANESVGAVHPDLKREEG
jgi:hypothetical protein